MDTQEKNVVLDFTDYVFNEGNIWKKEKYLGGRVMHAIAFGKETRISLQYCAGGWFAEGWGGDIKFRVYGMTNAVFVGWQLFYCGLDEVIDETDIKRKVTGNTKEFLDSSLKELILAEEKKST